MDDRQAAEILSDISKNHSFTAEEKQAIETAIGVLGWTSLAKNRIRRIAKARRIKSENNAEWLKKTSCLKRNRQPTDKRSAGFTLTEMLVVIAIIGVLAGIVGVYLLGVRGHADDTRRISDLNQLGRFLSFGCLMPAGGAGEYDLNELMAEYKSKYPQYADSLPSSIRDPKTGTDTVSNYKYLIDANRNCTLYANLENEDEEVTLSRISTPTPGGGRGVFAAPVAGWNGSIKYYQISN